MHLNDYVLNQRLDAARTLLAESSLPNEFIATRVGFSSALYFSQTFKRFTRRTREHIAPRRQKAKSR